MSRDLAPSDVECLRALCERRLHESDCTRIERRLASAGVDRASAVRLVSDVTEAPDSRSAILALKRSVCDATNDDAALERWLLLCAALPLVDRLSVLPVPESVKQLMADDVRFLGDAPSSALARYRVERSAFVDMCKKMTARRFSGGQFDWERSGIPRSYLLRVPAPQMPRVAAFVALRMRGLGPVFFSHLNPRRAESALGEVEANRSYYRMARAMAQQPDVIGFGACSWFRSPDTHRVSPRLAWVSKVFVENGGLVVRAGDAEPECGVLYRSATRRRLYEAGEFKPTVGLVMWPRRAMLAWAAAHPELDV